jgi:hypothetical protein
MRKNLTPISTPDFNSVYESMGEVLRSVPAQQRQKYVDAYLLTGDGAQKLVAAMYKDNPALMNPQPQMQAPQGTVIGNMAQQVAAAPEDMGIAQLPVENIGEEAFATGGIVAFDEGGEVPGFAGPDGSLVYSGNSITDPNFSNIIKGYQAALPGIIAKYKRGVPLSDTEKNAVMFLQQQGEVPASLGSFFTAEPVIPSGLEYKAPTSVKPAKSTITGKLSQEDIGAAGKDAAAEYKAEQGLGSLKDKPTTSQESAKDKGIGGIPAVPDLFKSFKGLQVTDVKPLTESDLGIGEKPSMQGVASLRKDAYKEAGIDESVYKDRLDDVKRRLTGIEGDRKDAVANALVMAGLGIAGGKSQFALTNVAEGALPAFKEYRADLRDLRDREDKVKESEFATKDAQMKFRQTGTDTDLKNYLDLDKEYRQDKKSLATANKTIEMENAKRKDEMNKLGLDVAFKQAGLNLQRFTAETQRMVANRPDLVTAALGMLNGSEKFKSATGDEKLAMFTDTLFNLKGRTTGEGSKGYTYRGKLQEHFLPTGTQYTKYNAIKKGKQKYKGLSGDDAAEAFRRDWIAQEMGKDPDASANVIDFGSLPD